MKIRTMKNFLVLFFLLIEIFFSLFILGIVSIIYVFLSIFLIKKKNKKIEPFEFNFEEDSLAIETRPIIQEKYFIV